MILRSLGFLLICIQLQLHGFIYHLQVLRKWDPKQNQYHYVVGCGDWHDKSDQATHLHRNQLEQFIRSANPATTKLIVEDLSTMQNGKPAHCRNFSVNTHGGLLGGLAQVCCESKLAVENIEHRYCRVASVGPLLHNPNKDLKSSRPTCTIQVGDILAEIRQSTAQLMNSLHPECTKFKAPITKTMQCHTRDLHLKQHEQLSMADYVSMHQGTDKRFDLFKALLVFDSSLLDLKIVNAVLNGQDKKTVVVIAGGTHIMRAADMLKQSGYEKVYTSTIRYKPEYDLKRCVGAPIEKNNYCSRPEPIALSLLEQYVRRY